MIKDIIHTEEGWYEEFDIPKKNGTFRHIVAPNPSLKAYQRNKLPYLEKIYHNIIQDSPIKWTAHGFLPDRNCVTAAIQHIGFDYTIMIDIKDFFDSVYRKHLAPYSSDIAMNDNLWHLEGHAAQGFATSPILANIASLDMIKDIKEYLTKNYSKHAFTIYADDIQISINDRKNIWIHTNRIINRVTKIATKYGFNIHKYKTHISQAKHGYRHMLGMNVGKDNVRASRKTMRKIRAAKHQGNYQSQGGLVTWSRCLLPIKLRK